MPKIIQSDRDTWPEAMATVTACKYESGAGRAMAFGLPTTRHFRITYNYWAPNVDNVDELHTGELTSEKAMHVGTLFPIRYNPDASHETTHSTAAPALTRNPLLVIGILGSVVLSLAWLLILRGC
ncbi:MAG TPA: DUF3592 domain-containing protein [Acidobacteriaceae bacterium]|nr:DUF3592 domain-containing protein [Acidobacteriaceae bacterium]